jgi:hypothetical protein
VSERYFGRAADLFGLVAYWTVMYGRLPDRNTLAELYTQASGTLMAPRPRFSVVPGSAEPPMRHTEAEGRIDNAA